MASKFDSIASGNSFPAGGEIKSENKTDVSDKQTLLAVLQFLKKNNLKGTEELLKKETGLDDADVKPDTTGQSASEVSHALAAYKSDDDPSLYDDHYTNFKVFIESCLDVHKVELATILYPVFVHMYLELVYNGHEHHAMKFFAKYSMDQEEYYTEDLNKLSTVTKAEHMKGSQLMENFKSSKFVLKMSRDSYTHLKRYLQEKQLNLLLNVIQEHLFIDVFDGIPRTKQQIDMTSGGLLGESAREANKTKIFYGLLKEPEINIPAEDDDDGGGDGEDKPKVEVHHNFRKCMKMTISDKTISENVFFLAFLYFLQGIPYGLQSRFLPLYFRTHGMSLSNIGYFKLLLIPWVSKALWAPLVDHYGTKKTWLGYSMIGLSCTCILGSFTSPKFIAQIAFILLLFNLLTATQDIAVDGLAIQILATSELASGNIAQVVGYKFGTVFSGGLLAWLSDISWDRIFLGLAFVYLMAYFIVLKVVPDSIQVKNEKDTTAASSSGQGRTSENSMNENDGSIHKKDNWILEHIKMVLSAEETRWTLFYVFIYKLGEQGALTMMPLFLVDKGMTSYSVGFWTGLVGQGVSILGSFVGGWLISVFWYTPHKVLTFFSVIRPLVLTCFVILISVWTDGSKNHAEFYYICIILCYLLLLLGSGVVTTTTFTLMMYCSQRSPSRIQASHYTTMATVEVLGKLTFSIVIEIEKKKQRKDPLMTKKARNDPNAPAASRLPMPELKDIDKMEKINAYREALKRVKIGPNSPPSICFYTFHNAVQGLTSVEISEDSSLMCTGFGDSNIKIWSLTPNKLRSMKQLEDLEIIDKESDDVLERMMDERTSEDTKLLVGHSGPVYSASFSPDRNYLTSSSEDGTVRLWSLQTWTNLVSYKGHNAPVWDVKFSPHGHYFVSGGNDRVARLWTTDHYQPVRIFAGHFSDVDSVQFHPNGNYVATGSSDRAVRIFDVLNGTCVRTLTGHKGAVHSLCFSPDGRYLASSGLDSNICLWDISNGNMLAQMRDHTSTVYSLCFSRCGAVLASGGLDNCVKLWDVTKVIKEMDKDMDANIPSSLSVNENPNLLIGSFATKATPILSIHFTRKNLLLASGPMKVS